MVQKHLTFWEIWGSFNFKLSIYNRGDKLLLSEVYQMWQTHSSRFSIQEDQRDGGRKQKYYLVTNDHVLSLLLFPLSKSTQTGYPKGCRIGRELISGLFNDYSQRNWSNTQRYACIHIHALAHSHTTYRERYPCAHTHTRRAYSEIVAREKCVSLCPWISFVIKTPRSQPVGKMRDLYLHFLTSVTGDFLLRPFTPATAGWWMSWGRLSTAGMSLLCYPPQGAWLTGSAGVPTPVAGGCCAWPRQTYTG